jgi:hypothetical protein
MNQQQPMYEEEYDSPEENLHGKSAIYIVAYFLLLALLVVPALKLHLGMPGIVFSMIGAGLVLALLVLGFKFLKRKLEHTGLSRREIVQIAVGYSPYAHAHEGVSGAEEEVLAEGEIIEEDALPSPPERIIEEHPLVLSERYQPSVTSFLGATVALIGMRRSGKSNLLAVLAEEFAKYRLPFVLFDTEAEYSELVSPLYLQRPILAGNETQVPDAHKAHYVLIDQEGAYDFGQAIMQSGLQVVVDLRSYEDDEAALVMSEIINGIEDWQQARPNGKRVPITVLLDESQKWFPQNKEDKVVSADVQALLDQAFYGTVVARGGKRGFGLVVAAQRYSQLNKKLLQSQHKFLFFQNEEVDIARYAKLGIPAEGTTSLQQGECYCFGPSVIGMRVRMRERFSPHGGHTPGLDNLTQHTLTLAPVSEVLRTSFSKSGMLAPSHVEGERRREQTQLERALDAYHNGAVSARKLGEALGIGKDAANELLQQMDKRGWITRERNEE